MIAHNMRKLAVIDTNVIVSGVITTVASSPTARILDGMLKAEIVYLLSEELLCEYGDALCRPAIVKRHLLTDAEIDTLLATFVMNAVWREPPPAADAPDSGDNHLWRLLASEYGSILVTGDKLLLNRPPIGHSVVSPGNFLESFNDNTVHDPAPNCPYHPPDLGLTSDPASP